MADTKKTDRQQTQPTPEETAATAAAEAEKKSQAEKGLQKALQKERTKRRDAEKELARIIAESGGDSTDVEFGRLGDDDLDGGVEKVNEIIAQQETVIKGLQTRLDEVQQGRKVDEVTKAVQDVVAKYEIFGSEDALAEAAGALLVSRVRALPKEQKTPEGIDEVAKLVAQELSRKATETPGEEKKTPAGETFVPGAGAGGSEHLKGERPKTDAEAREKSRGIIAKFAARKG